MSEESLHRTVVQYLKLAMPEGVFWFHPANGGYKLGKRTAGRLKAMGMVAGVPDICLVHRGQLYGIELKAAGIFAGNAMKGRGYLSKDQRTCHAAMREAGAIIATCWSLDDVQHSLKTWGVPQKVPGGGLFSEKGAA